MMASALSRLKKSLGFSGPIEETSRKKKRASSLPGELCRYFSLDEIKTATHSFDKELIVGVGGFGNVYKGFITDHDGNTRLVAIKRLNPESSIQGVQEFRTEVLLLCQIHHVHLISFIGYCNDEGELILVYDLASNDTLRSHLYETHKDPLPWKQRLQICIGAARGLHCLHTGLKNPVIHRDVKTTNILLDEKWVAKVSDFGLSKQVLNDVKFSNRVVEVEGTREEPSDFGLSEQILSTTEFSYSVSSGKRVLGVDSDKIGVSTMVKGTFGYADPEYVRSGLLTEKSDVYSFGVVLWEVLSARKVLNGKMTEEQWHLANWARICNKKGNIDKIIDPILEGKIAPECFNVYVEIAMTCIQDKGIERPTMVEVIEKLELALELQEKADVKNVLFAAFVMVIPSGSGSCVTRVTVDVGITMILSN